MGRSNNDLFYTFNAELVSGDLYRDHTYPYFSFNSFISGALIFSFIGARIPFSDIVPLRTCLTAVHVSVIQAVMHAHLPTPHGMPTSLAIAEYPPDPVGAPYSQSVLVLVSVVPSAFSISNLC
jgi:hypothetical protein